VVSFDCPCGPKDIVRDGEDGILVENGNIDLLASSLSRLMNDGFLRQSMSKAGLKNVHRFNIEQIADQWRLLFESLNIDVS
jgi:glycosyltransferase involved in cell wall biosynthesis